MTNMNFLRWLVLRYHISIWIRCTHSHRPKIHWATKNEVKERLCALLPAKWDGHLDKTNNIESTVFFLKYFLEFCLFYFIIRCFFGIYFTIPSQCVQFSSRFLYFTSCTVKINRKRTHKHIFCYILLIKNMKEYANDLALGSYRHDRVIDIKRRTCFHSRVTLAKLCIAKDSFKSFLHWIHL